MNDPRPISTGDGPADPGSADDFGGDPVVRNLSTKLEALERQRAEAARAHEARIKQLNSDASLYQGTLATEAQLLREQIQERISGGEARDEQASSDAEALRA